MTYTAMQAAQLNLLAQNRKSGKSTADKNRSQTGLQRKNDGWNDFLPETSSL